jgi:hypothetical protein
MSKRNEIRSSVLARNSAGETMEHIYTASYSNPVRDDIGMLVFDWTGTIDGAGVHPESRIVVVRAPGGEIAPAFVQRTIERSIVEHLESRGSDHAAALP